MQLWYLLIPTEYILVAMSYLLLTRGKRDLKFAGLLQMHEIVLGQGALLVVYVLYK